MSSAKEAGNEDDSPHARFVENMMRYLFHGIEAKDKTVRFRCCQLIGFCIGCISELSADVWNVFKVKMSERLFDKEAAIRVQAVIALTKFQGGFIDDANSIGIIDLFSDLLQHDPNA